MIVTQTTTSALTENTVVKAKFAKIGTALDIRVTTGKVNIEFLDSSSTVVKTIPYSNMTVWVVS